MTLRGRLSEVPKELVVEHKEEILKLYYEGGVKQQEIRKRLGLSSVSIVAEILRRDMLERIADFKKIDPKSAGYPVKTLEIIKFLKNQRKMDYSSIAVALGFDRDFVFRVISDEETGLRNSLSSTERADRNKEMVRLSKEEGLSLTDIGRRMGISKQMVSRIFKDMDYVPIKGTRKIRVKTNIPELSKFIAEDCNAKLTELNDTLRKVKAEYASSRQYNAKVITELRCMLVKEMAKHITLDNYEEFKRQSGFVNKIYNGFVQTTTEETRPPYFNLLQETVRVIDNTIRNKSYKSITSSIKGNK